MWIMSSNESLTDAPSVAALRRRLLGGAAAEKHLGLRFAGYRLRLASNDDRVVDELRAYYGSFVDEVRTAPTLTVWSAPATELELDWKIKPREGGKTGPKEAYLELPDGRLVRKLRTGMLFLLGADDWLAYGPCRDYLNQVVNFINGRFLARELERDGALLHASAVAAGERALALAGFSGMGKSSLALELMGPGLDFVSNDRLVLRREHGERIVVGVPKHPRINPGTALNNPALHGVLSENKRLRYAELEPEELWDVEDKHNVHIGERYGPRRFRLRAGFAGLVILNWRHGGGPTVLRRVRLVERRDLFSAFTKAPGLFYRPLGKALTEVDDEAYLELLAEAPVYEISGGIDFTYAAAACRELLGD